MTPVPNGEDGVRIEDGSSNEVGGIVSGSGNVISANKHNGVEIVADQTSEQGVTMPASLQNAQDNLVEQNLIGTDSTGTTSNALGVLGNGQDGVALTENNPAGFVSGNVIGGTDASDGILDGKDEAGNLISGNLANGVYLLGDAVVNNSIEGNRIGTNVAGTAAIPNAHSGVFLDRIASEPFGPGQNTIGGTAVGAGNQISGNGTPATSSQAAFGDGITINLGSDGNTIVGNLIGTDGTGLLRLGNAANGVAIDNSSGNVIGAKCRQRHQRQRRSGRGHRGLRLPGEPGADKLDRCRRRRGHTTLQLKRRAARSRRHEQYDRGDNENRRPERYTGQRYRRQHVRRDRHHHGREQQLSFI